MIKDGKKIVGADLVDQREELNLSIADHIWLCGMLTKTFRITEEEGQKPIPNVPITILARYFNEHPEDAFVPEMPVWEEVFELVSNVAEEKISPRKFGMLFGSTGWTGNRWYHGGEPSPPVKRLFYLLKKKIEEEGAEGFRKYMAILEKEAHAQGFEDGLHGVFKAGGWKSQGKDQEEETEETKDQETEEKK